MRLRSSSFWIALSAVAAASTLPMVYYASLARIEFDGWWHVLIARDDRWDLMVHEIFKTAHPPLYFLLLRLFARIGYDPVVYRVVSIIAAAAGVVAVGVAMRRLTKVPALAVLTAGAFGFATSTVIIANEVRSYMVAAAFLLASLPSYLRLVGPGEGRWARMLFAGFLILALLSHYGVLIPVACLLATPVLVSAFSRRYRRDWRNALPRRWAADVATVLPVVAVAAVCWVHISAFSTPMSHLPDYYYSGAEPVWRFVARSAVQEVDLFTPVSLTDQGALAQVLAVVAALLVPGFALGLAKRRRDISFALLPLLFLVLVGVQLAAAIAGRYPFGGGLRHQFFVFPFWVMCFFLLVDRLISRLAVPWPRRLAAVAGFALVALGTVFAWERLPLPRTELFVSHVATFRDEIPPADAIYVNGFSYIAFFSQYHDWHWATEGLLAGDRLRLFRLTRDGESLRVLADLNRWNPSLAEDAVWRDLRAALGANQASSLAIFHLDQASWASPPPSPTVQRQAIATMLAAARSRGLEPRKIVHASHGVFARAVIASSLEADHGPPEIETTAVGAGLHAHPNPIQVCRGAVGTTVVSWDFGSQGVQLRLQAPHGKLWAATGSEGSAETGPWVTDGMRIYAQDAANPSITLGSVLVRHTRRGCAPAAESE